MIVKRISYFTFMVAITTMATVSSCQKANAHSISFEDFNTIVAALSEHEIFDFSFYAEDAANDYNAQLQKLLKTKGLKAETFHVKATCSGQQNVLNLVLVVDKNYKGPVAPAIFDSPINYIPLDYSINYSQFVNLVYPSLVADTRKIIERKNRILLI